MKTKPKPRFLGRLSSVQKTVLCTLAGQAQTIAKSRGDFRAAVDRETWRKNGQDEATGVQGLSLAENATQAHFLPIRGYWFTIIGNLEQAFYDFLNAGEQNEATKQMKWRLAGEVSRLADGIKQEKSRLLIPITLTDEQAAKEAWNYTKALCSDKFQQRPLSSLNADEVEQLCHTVFNRASAKLDVGSTKTRNKSQTMLSKSRRKASQTASEEPLNGRFSEADRNRELALAAEEPAWAG